MALLKKQRLANDSLTTTKKWRISAMKTYTTVAIEDISFALLSQREAPPGPQCP
jgi:hypothetical protein